MRNNTADIIRGFAMLLVVLGHTISGTVRNYSNSLLFQAIWTLQMPLFIIISGYVTRYSRPLTKGKDLWMFIQKRTLAYLLPWIVWSLIVRGLVFGQTYFLDLKHMFWHMDSGYWFLITIWSISMIFGLTDFLSNRYFKNRLTNILSHLVLFGIGLIGLVVLGYFTEIEFFSIKLTLYYSPIYLIGYIYGQVQDRLLLKAKISTIINYIIIASLGLWLTSINRLDFFGGEDSIRIAIERFITSILGCIAIIGLLAKISDKTSLFKFIKWAGVHSLEIYLTHYLFLKLAPATDLPALTSINGFISLIINLTLTLILTIATIKIIQSNKELNYLLYAKRLLQQQRDSKTKD